MRFSIGLGLLVCMLTGVISVRQAAWAADQTNTNGGNKADGKHLEQQSFIRVREVCSSSAWGGDWIKKDMPLELRHKLFMPFWPEERLRCHLEMLKAFGFNSIQISDSPINALWVGADPKEWRKRVLFRCKVAHELGMSVSMFIWGATVADITQGGQQYSELDWHKPEDRTRLEAWYHERAELAPYVDRVITHWVDPGNPKCNECTIDTVVEMHNFIMGIYREKNPKIRGTLSTWFMVPGKKWPGYESAGKLAAHPKLDRDTDIAWGWRIGPKDELDAIVAAGRRAAVWGWYTADDEIRPALHVRIGVLENCFPNKLMPQKRAELAPRWTDGLAWYSLDDNFHGLNMQNLYVAGKLMQDPSLDAQQLLDEFVRGFVGETNAPAVAAALRAVEQARTKSYCYTYTVPDAVDIRTTEQKNMTDIWLSETPGIVTAALQGLKSVKLAPNFKPAWPVVLEPQDYLAELQAHLEAIRQMLTFLTAVREVERLKAAGAPVEKLETAINALPKVIYDPAHTAGLETMVYRNKLATLKKAALGK